MHAPGRCHRRRPLRDAKGVAQVFQRAVFLHQTGLKLRSLALEAGRALLPPRLLCRFRASSGIHLRMHRAALALLLLDCDSTRASTSLRDVQRGAERVAGPRAALVLNRPPAPRSMAVDAGVDDLDAGSTAAAALTRGTCVRGGAGGRLLSGDLEPPRRQRA
eukprot:jgi/Tetstr1/458580/TSEL_044983.t1